MDTSPLSWSSLLLTIPLLLMFYFAVLWRQKNKAKLVLPPGPSGLPIVGNLLQLGRKPNESLWALSRKYGPLMTLSLGMKTTVVVSSPAMAKELLKTHGQIFAGRSVRATSDPKSFPDQKPSLIFGEYGTRWRNLRRIATTELFSHSRLEALQHLRRDQVFSTLRLIFEDKEKTINIGHQAFYTSLNLLGNMIFGTSVFDPRNLDSAQFKDTVGRMMKLAGKPNLVDFFPFLGFLDPQGLSREMLKHVQGMHNFFDVFIKDRLASGHKSREGIQTHKDFLDVLLDCRSEDFTLADIRAMILELFLAGSETTSTTIEWGMAELISNPPIMKLVQHELDNIVGVNRRVEESDIEHLPYLSVVMKEVFRLHPAAPLLIPHKAESSCEVAGYLIPKDTEILVNVWGMGRDGATWKDPLKFLPERFTEGEKSNIEYRGHDFELLPFGAGRRICPGLPLATRMVHLVVASLSHAFDWSLPNGRKAEEMDMGDDFGITLKKAVDLCVIPTPRLRSDIYYE